MPIRKLQPCGTLKPYLGRGKVEMPKVKLKTGVELYYEEHGKGVPIILLQGTGFALDVW